MAPDQQKGNPLSSWIKQVRIVVLSHLFLIISVISALTFAAHERLWNEMYFNAPES